MPISVKNYTMAIASYTIAGYATFEILHYLQNNHTRAGSKSFYVADVDCSALIAGKARRIESFVLA